MGDKMKKIQSKLQKLKKYNSTFKIIRTRSQTKNSSTSKLKNNNLQNIEDNKPQQPQKDQQNKEKIKPSLKRKSKSSSLQKIKYSKDANKTVKMQKKLRTKTDQIEEERKERMKEHENEEKRQNVNFPKKFKTYAFEIVTQKHQNNIKYTMRGTFRLFNSSHPAQHLFIQQAFHISDILKQKFHIVLGMQSKMFNEQNFDDLEPYHEIVLNSAHIPQCLQDGVRNSEQFFEYLYEHRRKMQLRVSNGKMHSITHLAITYDAQHIIYIPLYYGKDRIVGRQKQIGYAQFNDKITKKMFYDVLNSEQRRCSFYAKSLEISQKSHCGKRDGFVFNKIAGCIKQIDVRTLRLMGDLSLGWEYQLRLSGLIILDVDNVDSIEVLQNFEFHQLKCIIIGSKRMLNLRSLRKLHINADAQMNLTKRCEQSPYPLRFAIERGLSNKQQYTFTNLSYLTEVPFSFSCSNHKCLNKVKYLNSNDTIVPINLLAKLGDSSITTLKFNNYSDLNVAYTFVAKYLSIIKRKFSVLLDRFTERDRI